MGYPNTFAPFDQYPHAAGPKMIGQVVHAGPDPYVQLVVASAGDKVYAVDGGLKWIDSAEGGLTSDGLYRVEVVNPTAGPQASVQLRWVVVATGAQVAADFDLSGSSVSLTLRGW